MTDNERIHDNGIKTILLRDGWWGFDDLLQAPFIRQAYAKQIEDNYTYGTSAYDMKMFFTQVKELLQSKDAEKYEKIYALVLKKKKVLQPYEIHLNITLLYVPFTY